MEFLASSLLELIVQTSTNLPPDVRAAMAATAATETPGTQSAQALGVNFAKKADVVSVPAMSTFNLVDHVAVRCVHVLLEGPVRLRGRGSAYRAGRLVGRVVEERLDAHRLELVRPARVARRPFE